KREQVAKGRLAANVVGGISLQKILYLLNGTEDRDFVEKAASPCSMRLGGSLALPIPAGFEFFHTFLVAGGEEIAWVATTLLFSNSSWVCPRAWKSLRRERRKTAPLNGPQQLTHYVWGIFLLDFL